MAGIELVAYKLYGEDVWNVKEGRCNFCGKCCENLLPSSQLPVDGSRTCAYLGPDIGDQRECLQGALRPWGCCTGLQKKGYEDNPDCTVTYNEIA